jgi:hypothetical protein
MVTEGQGYGLDGCRHKGDPSDQMAGAIALIDTGGIQSDRKPVHRADGLQGPHCWHALYMMEGPFRSN